MTINPQCYKDDKDYFLISSIPSFDVSKLCIYIKTNGETLFPYRIIIKLFQI